MFKSGIKRRHPRFRQSGRSSREARESMLKSASIRAIDSSETVSCTIRNISSRGARISAADIHRIPQRFMISTGLDIADRIGEIVWRHNNEIGLKFVTR